MIGRRKAMLGLVGCAVCGQATAQLLPDNLTPRRALAVARGCGTGLGQTASERPRRLARCGVKVLDDNIERELTFLRRMFGIEPDFHFADDTSSKLIAKTVREGEGASTVMLGVNFIQREMRMNPSHWELAIIGVLAHEWAHAMQYASSLQDTAFMWETHADFMAGWYLGVKRAVGLRQVEPGPLAMSLFEKGSTKDFFDPDDYGSPDVRVQAMLKGFDIGFNGLKKVPLDARDAANEGYRHTRGVAAR